MSLNQTRNTDQVSLTTETRVDVSQPPPWRPSDRMERYAFQCENPAISRTIAARAAAAGISRQVVYKWQKIPEFRAWLSTQRRQAFEDCIDDVKQRCVELALQGSAEHIRIVLELAGLVGRGRFDHPAHGENQTIVQINVPRPYATPLAPVLDAMPRPTLRDPKDTIDVQPFIRPVVPSDEEQ